MLRSALACPMARHPSVTPTVPRGVLPLVAVSSSAIQLRSKVSFLGSVPLSSQRYCAPNGAIPYCQSGDIRYCRAFGCIQLCYQLRLSMRKSCWCRIFRYLLQVLSGCNFAVHTALSFLFQSIALNLLLRFPIVLQLRFSVHRLLVSTRSRLLPAASDSLVAALACAAPQTICVECWPDILAVAVDNSRRD